MSSNRDDFPVVTATAIDAAAMAGGCASPSTVTRLLLLRHGQTEGNRLGQLLGITDIALNPTGREQARRLGRWLAKHVHLDAIYSSALRRAHETAALICAELARTEPHVVEPMLGEINFGEAEGTPTAEIATRFPHLAEFIDETLPHHPDWQWPGGDFRLAYYQGVVETLDHLASDHRGETVAIVTHGGVISGYLLWLNRRILGYSLRFAVGNCSITELRWHPSDVEVVTMGAKPWENDEEASPL